MTAGAYAYAHPARDGSLGAWDHAIQFEGARCDDPADQDGCHGRGLRRACDERLRSKCEGDPGSLHLSSPLIMRLCPN